MYNKNDWVQRVAGTSENGVDTIYNTVAENNSSAKLIAALFKGNQTAQRAAPGQAVPEGYGYVPYPLGRNKTPVRKDVVTAAYHAHPSDISSDFASYLIMHSANLNDKFHQIIATRGEAARLVRPLPEGKDLISIRKEEEERASAILGVNPDYLKTKNGSYFPDGKLLEHLLELKEQIKDDIRKKKPDRILLPSPWPDHADHLAVYVAGMNAIVELEREEHFFDRHKIEILACEPEFGVAIGQQSAVPKIPKAYGGALHLNPGIDISLEYFPYKYGLDESGVVKAASDITASKDNEALKDVTHYPVAIPPVIITVGPEMVKKKISALLQHETQVNGKNYDMLIPALDHLRGLTVGKEWGMGIYPIEVKGVTDGGPSLINSLKPGTVFQLQKGAPSKEVPFSHLTRVREAENYMGMWI